MAAAAAADVAAVGVDDDDDDDSDVVVVAAADDDDLADVVVVPALINSFSFLLQIKVVVLTMLFVLSIALTTYDVGIRIFMSLLNQTKQGLFIDRQT